MPMNRIKVRDIVLIVGLIAVGLGAVREATAVSTIAIQYGTYILLVIASVFAAVSGRRHAASSGFAILGWAYFMPLCVLGSPSLVKQCPTSLLILAYAERSIALPIVPDGYKIIPKEEEWPKRSYTGSGPVALSKQVTALISDHNEKLDNALATGHCGFTVLSAIVGAILGRILKDRFVESGQGN